MKDALASWQSEVLSAVGTILKFALAALAAALVVVVIGVAAVVGASPFQWYRTCHGKHCLDQYRRAEGAYQIPDLACVKPVSFYFPSKYEKHPEQAKEYFRTLYFYLGDALAIYLTDQDRYIFISQFNTKSPELDLIGDEVCTTDLTFHLN